MPTRRPRPRRDGVRARRDRRVHHRHDGRRRGADPRRRLGRSASTSAPTACARSRSRSPIRSSTSRPRRREVVERYATMTEYDEDWDLPGRLPAAPAGDRRIAQVDRRRRLRAAARRRDREVPARDVLLQRRRGGAVRGRGARAGALAARRPDLRPQAGDERPRGDRRVRRALGASDEFALRDHQLRQRRHGRPHRRDPGRGRRRSRPSTRASGESSRPSTARAARCLVTADHGNCRPDARGRRLARHRALAQPGAVHRHRPGR